jgi:hypothetical protein
MEIAKFKSPNYIADIVVLDQNEKIVLLVEVKAQNLQDQMEQQTSLIPIKLYLQEGNENKPFVMLVDLENIMIFESEQNDFSEPIICLKTDNVLNNYDENFSELKKNNRISGFYLETLVESWLRDLAYHWQSLKPPESDKLKNIGFLQRIEGGTTNSQVNLHGHTLR